MDYSTLITFYVTQVKEAGWKALKLQTIKTDNYLAPDGDEQSLSIHCYKKQLTKMLTNHA
jgi:sialic acid synthase SpsE